MTASTLALSWGDWHLAEPVALAAGALAALPWIASRRRRRIAWPTLEGFRAAPAARAGGLRHVPTLLQSLAFLLLALALARPRAIGGQERIAARGVAIVAAIDRSASMTTADFPGEGGERSRLDAARKTLERFVEGRPDDLIGVVAFANVPRRASAPTLDHAFVVAAVRAIRPARSGEGGTNLGHALALGLGDLRAVGTPRKVLILLTDGRDAPAVSDAAKPISPEAAASLAGDLGITVHTIAIGGPGIRGGSAASKSPVDEPGPDFERLQELARLGGGQAFSATDAYSLASVFAAIDALEKSPMVGTVRTRYREGYPLFVAAGLTCLALGRLSGRGAAENIAVGRVKNAFCPQGSIALDFARPQALLLLLLIPAGIVGARFAHARRSRAWSRLGRPGRLTSTRPVRWFLAASALIVALAGPRFGLAPGSELPPGHDVVLLVDASRSMAAEDVVPDRLGAAVAAAGALTRELGREPGSRAAVVAFAGNAEPRCPLTERIEAAEDCLRAIRPGEVRPGGTDLGGAILAALDSFDPQEPSEGRAIVVLTDGEDLAGSWSLLRERIRAAHVVIHGVTFGDAGRGHVIPVGESREPLRYRGETVLSRRDDRALAEICKETGGTFVPAGLARVDLAALYRERIGPQERRRHAAMATPERVDRSSFLIAGALGLLGASAWPRSRRIGSIVLLMAVGVGAGPTYRTAREAVHAGEEAYRSGDPATALEAFESAMLLDRTSPIPIYNTAAVLYRLGRYEDARKRYEEARPHASPLLKAKIAYALGNVAVAAGRYKEALPLYDECLGSSLTGPSIAVLKRDASLNRRFAERLIPPTASPDPAGDRETSDPKRPTDGPPGPEPGPEAQDSPDPAETPKAPDRPQGESPKGGAPGGARRPGASGAGESSPEARLNAMLDEVRKGQAASETPAAPAESSTTDRKDW